jgi:hypothetical protein
MRLFLTLTSGRYNEHLMYYYTFWLSSKMSSSNGAL